VSGGDLQRAATRRAARINRALDRRGIRRNAIADRAKITNVVNGAALRAANSSEQYRNQN